MGIFGRRREAQDPTAETDVVGDEAIEAADERHHGPFDRSEVDGLGERIDLGSLWVSGAPGLQLAFEVDQASQQVTGCQMVLDTSRAQVMAFAAPRTRGIWADVRAEMADQLTSAGNSAQVVDGPFGPALQVTAGGQRMLFFGIDGPRWFLRVALTGPAASSEAAAEPLLEVVRGLVVVRGAEAMPPREMLPLRLPELQEAPTDPGEESAADDLRPFERGPEITEVR